MDSSQFVVLVYQQTQKIREIPQWGVTRNAGSTLYRRFRKRLVSSNRFWWSIIVGSNPRSHRFGTRSESPLALFGVLVLTSPQSILSRYFKVGLVSAITVPYLWLTYRFIPQGNRSLVQPTINKIKSNRYKSDMHQTQCNSRSCRVMPLHRQTGQIDTIKCHLSKK